MPNSDMTKLLNFNRYTKAQIDTRLARFYDTKIVQARAIDPLYAKLHEDMKKFILRGGKRLRPTLMVLGYRAAGGKDIDFALDAALSLEIFHNFVLIHDDVMDGDLSRYGGANITGIYNKRFKSALGDQEARHTAESLAILAGELNEFFTFEVITALKTNRELILALMSHYQQVLFETAAGQMLDVMSGVRGEISLSKIEKVNYYKTAQYTITSPLHFGVIAAGGGDKKLIKDFSAFGAELGKAFQLADDLLGVFGSSRQTGKPVGSDIREGKQTLLMYHAKKLTTPLQWKAIESRLGKQNITPEDVKMVRSILKDSGAQAKVAVAAEDHLGKALNILDAIQLDTETKTLLKSFASYCVTRKK